MNYNLRNTGVKVLGVPKILVKAQTGGDVVPGVQSFTYAREISSGDLMYNTYDYSLQYFIVYLKFAKRVDLMYSHHTCKKVVTI